jgi:uncharacterized protein
MFIGSTIKVEKVAGTNIEMIQETDYPWSGKIRIIVNPDQPREFSLFIRVPDRSTSNLYKPVPLVNSIKTLAVNDIAITPGVANGYVKIRRLWKTGDKVDILLPMEVQTVVADERIISDIGRVALRYGPLIYNIEKADRQDINKNIGPGPFVPVWQKDMLGGIISIKGKWADGSDLIAIPNYTRNNRNTIHATDKPEEKNKDGGSIIWIKK